MHGRWVDQTANVQQIQEYLWYERRINKCASIHLTPPCRREHSRCNNASKAHTKKQVFNCPHPPINAINPSDRQELAMLLNWNTNISSLLADRPKLILSSNRPSFNDRLCLKTHTIYYCYHPVCVVINESQRTTEQQPQQDVYKSHYTNAVSSSRFFFFFLSLAAQMESSKLIIKTPNTDRSQNRLFTIFHIHKEKKNQHRNLLVRSHAHTKSDGEREREQNCGDVKSIRPAPDG